MFDKVAIVVASGTGSRMGTEIPKQFMDLDGKPIVIRTLEKFLSISGCRVILTLSEDGMGYWDNLTHDLDMTRLLVVKGGETRFHSVKNALNVLDDNSEGVIAIHDGVRPFVSIQTILNSFVVAHNLGSAVACVNAKDSIRIIDGEENNAIDRDKVKLIQTPQAFRFDILKRAYSVDYEAWFTDDASVVEKSGVKIQLIEGSYSNIKITTPEDLSVAEVLLKSEEF